MGPGYYIIKFIVGGVFVCAFAVISETWTPKRFAGIFSTAPSILLAGLVVSLNSEGTTKVALVAQGAIAGAIGMIVYCLLATPVIRRLKSLPGASLLLLPWFAVSLGVYAILGKAVGW
jgi:hypothetical protein